MRTELRPTNMAEAFVKAVMTERAHKGTTKRVIRVGLRPGAGLVDNNTGRPAPRGARK